MPEPAVDCVRDGLLANASSIDLQRLQAQTREISTTPWQSDQTGGFEVGSQANFDSEIPCLRESVWQRDFRRSAGQQLEPLISGNVTESAGGTSQRKDATKAEEASLAAAQESKKALAAADLSSHHVAAAAAATSATAKRPLAKKRKSIPDVQVEDEPKRKKMATKSKKK